MHPCWMQSWYKIKFQLYVSHVVILNISWMIIRFIGLIYRGGVLIYQIIRVPPKFTFHFWASVGQIVVSTWMAYRNKLLNATLHNSLGCLIEINETLPKQLTSWMPRKHGFLQGTGGEFVRMKQARDFHILYDASFFWKCITKHKF